jgi:DNA-binding NarL/FixJ family response regulator
MGTKRVKRPAKDPDEARIAVCAADRTVRARIEAALAHGGYVAAASSSSVRKLADTDRSVGPALYILACELEPFSTGEEVSAARAKIGEAPLVLVATGFLGTTCRKLVRKQVDGLVLEAQIEDALVATVDAVLADQLCVPASMRQTLAEPVFSHREKQVLELLLKGLTNGEIAAALHLSESTVKSHLASTFRKLGVSSRAEAARRVLAPDVDPELAALARTAPRR